MSDAARQGEIGLPNDPAEMEGDARLVFIGHVRSPWRERGDCPKNMTAARARGAEARIVLDPDYRPGLLALGRHSHLILLTWLHLSRRDLIVQVPGHADGPRGTFALRSPVRPNPVGLHVAAIVGIDAGTGTVTIDAIDVLDKTPVIDLKPYRPGIDRIDAATGPGD